MRRSRQEIVMVKDDHIDQTGDIVIKLVLLLSPVEHIKPQLTLFF